MSGRSGSVMIAMLATLGITYLVPLPFYGTFEALGWVELPQDATPARFMLSVLVIKIGVAFAFVMLFRLARVGAAGSWWRYATIWWLMFALIEVGQAIGPGYTMAEAAAGVLSEAVYFPLSSWVTSRILGRA